MQTTRHEQLERIKLTFLGRKVSHGMQNFQNSTTLSHFLRCAIFVPYFSAATIELRSKSEVLQVFRDAQMHSPTKTAEEELVVSNFYSGSRMAFVAPLTTFRRRTQQRLSCKSIGSKPVSWTLAAPRRSAVVASIGLASVDEAQNQSEELGEHLVRAAMLNDVQGVANALREGAAPNYASAKGGSNMTALMWATSNGSVEITSMLLSAGLTREDINAKNASDFTATLYCFDNLPSANPRPAPPSGFPNAVNFNRPTPPQVRIEKKATGHSNCAKLLLMNGADLFVVNMYNEGLLHMAARKGQLDWLRILVDKGLPLNARNKGYMNTPVILAAIEVSQLKNFPFKISI